MMNRTVRVLVAVGLVLSLFVGLAYAEKTCASCGTENSDSARFCKKCGAKLPSAPPQRPATPRVDGNAQVTGSVVRITSDPAEADVFVDGRQRGTTPLELTDLPLGRHELRISKTGYRDHVGSFAISGQYGVLVVTSDPVGAEVSLDGVLQGRTVESGLPLTRVPYGERRLTVRAAGYRDVEKTIDVKSAGPMAVNFRLGWGKGFVRIESDPAGATVLTGGRPLGESPMLAELDPARYMLTLTRRGFYDWTGYAQVQFAETALVLADLERIKTRKWMFLAAGLAGFAGGAYAAVKGESEYAKYRDARSRQESERYQASTQQWDMVRNVAAGFSGVVTVVFFTLRW